MRNIRRIVLTFCLLTLGFTFGEIYIGFTNSTYQYKLLDDHGFNSSGLQSIVFKIKSCKDAHIGLFETNDTTGHPYEILFGGWINTKCAIRILKQGVNQVLVDEVVLDCNEYVELWVSWFGHTIEAGRGTSVGCDVFMSWTDPTPRAITHIGAAMYYSSADFIFGFPYNETDCSITSTDNSDTTTLQESTTSDSISVLGTSTSEISTVNEATTSETTTVADTTTSETVVDTTLSETTTVPETTTSETLYSETASHMLTVGVDGTTGANCQCPCTTVNIINMTDEELAVKIKQLKLDLTIVSKDTNKYKRTLISSPDDRASSKVIGWSGILVLVFVIGTLIILDVQHFGRFFTPSRVASRRPSEVS